MAEWKSRIAPHGERKVMTNDKTADLRGNCGQAGLAAMGLRSGIAKDKLVFIIIFSAAMAVALVTMLSYLLYNRR